MWSRRVFLRGCGATLGITGLSGCLSLNSAGGGDLIIENTDSRQHTVIVTSTKWSNDPDAGNAGTPTTPADKTPHSRAEQEYTIAAESDATHRGVFTEPGTNIVKARLETGDSARSWHGLYSTVEGGPGGPAIVIQIRRNQVSFGFWYDD